MRWPTFPITVLCAAACSASPSTSGGHDAGTPDGGAPPGVLDCAWTAGPNCWQTVIAAATSCLPPATPQGTMSADGTTCTYASGTTVSFQPPLMVGPYATFTSFVVTTGGARCLSYAQNAAANGSSITTSAGTVSLAANPADRTLTVTCPDGSSFVGTAQTLAECPSGFPSFDVGYGGSGPADGGIGGVTHGHMGMTLNDTGTPDKTTVFDCAN